ncbi:MAG: hypothetical protein Q3962_07125 [Corynebacterium sp.]|nr:hypothetical protein [Corynebacterium sp.]
MTARTPAVNSAKNAISLAVLGAFAVLPWTLILLRMFTDFAMGEAAANLIFGYAAAMAFGGVVSLVILILNKQKKIAHILLGILNCLYAVFGLALFAMHLAGN